MTRRGYLCLLLIPALCLTSLSAIAQCATGVDTGGGNCVPPDAAGMPSYNQGQDAQPMPPPPKWEDSWGAIAIDYQTGSAGTVTDRRSRSQAVDDAMHDCASKGSTGCKVAASYRNQCASVAWSTKGYGVANSPTEDGAKGDALTGCERYGEKCKIVYSACSVAHRAD